MRNGEKAHLKMPSGKINLVNENERHKRVVANKKYASVSGSKSTNHEIKIFGKSNLFY